MRNRSAAYALCVSLSLAAVAQGLSPVSALAAGQESPQSASGEPELVPPPSWAFNDIACAPALALDAKQKPKVSPLRVLGSQDTTVRGLLGPGDTLVISGGASAGLEPGQRYFLRRLVTTLGSEVITPPTIHTVGWIQIVGVDTTLATATVMHACDGILFDDYLEPFTAPMVAARPLSGAMPQYANMGHIVTGIEGMTTAGLGQVMTIDRGGNLGVVLGQRFLVFRDRRGQMVDSSGKSRAFELMTGRLPLVEIGEVVVIAVRPEDSTVQVLGAKDAITSGDLIAPIR